MPPPSPPLAAQSAFGLTVLSDEPLPGLAPAGDGAHGCVRVHLRALPPGLAPGGLERAREWRPPALGEEPRPFRVHRLESGAFLLRYADGARFVLDPAGREVWADFPAATSLDEASTYLLGPVLGWVLRLRGTLALHAGVVAWEGRAVALAGPGGAGKSTAAAAFARAGWEVLADDVAALDEDAGAFRVRPAYPRLRLWEDSVRALFGAADALPRLCPGWEKRYLPLGGEGARFRAADAPLALVCLLEGADGAPALSPLRPAAALPALVPHTYAGVLLDAPARRAEFEALSRLVRSVPVRRLRAAATPGELPALVRAVADALAALPAADGS